MKTMIVRSKIENAGEYVPPDSVGCGDFYRDVFHTDVFTCDTKKRAKEIVQKARPRAKIIDVDVIVY